MDPGAFGGGMETLAAEERAGGEEIGVVGVHFGEGGAGGGDAGFAGGVAVQEGEVAGHVWLLGGGGGGDLGICLSVDRDGWFEWGESRWLVGV